MTVPGVAPHHRWERGAILLLGGARSGKSRAAVDLALGSQREVVFVATATAGDDDMAARIARHRGERPAQWRTIEAPLDLAGAIAAAADDSMVIVDCVTLWVTNLLLADIDEFAIAERAAELADLLAGRAGPSVVVSNEVGLGVVPEYELGRRFRDALGRANIAFANRAVRSAMLIAGRALPLRSLDEALA
jgi:adenosylcobinamide kinase / adenosylcobinamide-phosphate guanylyltransferase